MRGISAIEFIAYQAHLAYSAVLFFLNFPAQGRELDHLANAAAVIGLEKAQLSPACFGPALAGTKLTKLHPTLRPISASVGESGGTLR
jgi:hypothetical protein